jgi:translation initiation factor 2 subunit 1
MLYVRDGYPQMSEIVKCKVKKILGNTTFLLLEEYEKEGVLTISELSPGRIRSIKEFVKEGKIIICKVIRINERKRSIDLSLRRVSIPQKLEKQKQIKEEEFSEKLYIELSKILETNQDKLFEKTYEEIFENYESVYEFFYNLMNDNSKIDLLKKLNSKEKEEFIKIVNRRIKPENVVLKEKFNLTSTNENGVELIKELIQNSLSSIEKDNKNISIIYIAAGNFEIKIIEDTKKRCNEIFKIFTSNLVKNSKDKDLILKISED